MTTTDATTVTVSSKIDALMARAFHVSPAAMANEMGLRNVAFGVDDLHAAVDAGRGRLRLVGGIGRYEHIWRMAYVRGPEGIIVSLAERID